MSKCDRQSVPEILKATCRGEAVGSDKLLPSVYSKLRAVAQVMTAKLRPGQTLQATALVHEAYLKLVNSKKSDWNGRTHFFFAAAQAMRQILTDRARYKRAVKHGGDCVREDLDVAFVVSEPPIDEIDLLDLDEALNDLEKIDARCLKVVELRLFAGLKIEEIAKELGVSMLTVKRDWRKAMTWLNDRLGDATDSHSGDQAQE